MIWRWLSRVPAWLKYPIAAGVCLLISIFALRLGDVNTPHFGPIPEGRVIHLDQGWEPGWGVKPLNQRDWFHHASQGTRIMPHAWFVNLEQPAIASMGRRITEDRYLERFGFLPSPRDARLNPDELPVGFAIEEDYDAPYASPPWKPEKGPVVGLTCAACHTGQVTFKDRDGLKAIRIEGGSAMINLSAFQDAIGQSLWMTVNLTPRREAFVRRVLGESPSKARKDELIKDLECFLEVGLTSKEYARANKLTGTVGGFGRTDALGLIGNRLFVALGNENLAVPDAPVNFPPLWDTPWFDWVQYNASIRMPMVRNIGEALGVGASVNLDDEGHPPLFQSTVNVQNLHLMETQLGGESELGGLRPPKWPVELLGHLDEERKSSGKKLYGHHCQKCHLPPIDELKASLDPSDPNHLAYRKYWEVDPSSKKRFLKLTKGDLHEIGTDPNQAMNLYRRVAVFRGRTIPARHGLFAVTEMIRRDKYDSLGASGEKKLGFNRFRSVTEGSREDVLDQAKGIDEVLKSNTFYKARPLDGIWATPPYLHNGSVPNLYQLLLPVEERDREFYLGSTLYDREHVGFETGYLEGGFKLDTRQAPGRTTNGNSNAGHEFRNLTLDELEQLSAEAACPTSEKETRPSRDRWAAVLKTSPEHLAALSEKQFIAKVREATEAALKDPRVVRNHPFLGVIGPLLTEDEREDLIEYLKSL